MLDDRSYMRDPAFGKQRSLTVVILVINAVIFLLQEVIGYYFRSVPFNQVFALSWDTLKLGYVWQLFTFQFLHGGLLHILLNSWGIYVFGKAVEDVLGSRNFLKLYLISGVVGGLVHVVGSWLLPHNFGGYYYGLHAPVMGASAGLFGLIAAFAALFPERQLTLLLFFVLPVTLTARVMLWASAALAVFGIIVPKDNIAHGAHLGGLVAGLLYIKLAVQGSWSFPRLWPQRPQRIKLVPKIASSPKILKNDESEVFTDDFITREVDAILDKISAHGIQSLTDREKRILEAARARMSKR